MPYFNTDPSITQTVQLEDNITELSQEDICYALFDTEEDLFEECI